MHLTGLEPALLSEMEPKSIVSASSTTSANGKSTAMNASDGNRTHDTLIKSQVLYQLSYERIFQSMYLM